MSKRKRYKIPRLSKGVKREIVDTYLVALLTRIAKGERVYMPGIGVWYRSVSKPRKIQNPKTGEPMMLKATWHVGFRASKFWKGHQR